MAGTKTCPTQEGPAIKEGRLDTQKRDGEPESHSDAPLSLYLSKLLSPSPRPREPILQPPIPASPGPAAEPARIDSVWQRAKSSAARSLQGVTPHRRRKEPGSSPIAAKHSPSVSRRAKPAIRSAREHVGDVRQKIMMALVPVLGVVMAFLLKNPLKLSPATQAQIAPTGAATPMVDSNIEIAWEVPAPYQLGGRDPMRLPEPPIAEVAGEPAPNPVLTHVELTVTGILYSPDRPAAIVDTQLVREGQQISGALVKKIERNGVEFEMNGQTWKQAVGKQ